MALVTLSFRMEAIQLITKNGDRPRSPDLPKQVEIKAGQTTKLDISIDTGIIT